MQLLEEEMLPALEKLRTERACYMEWQQACSDADSLGHVVLAHRYWQASLGAEAAQNKISSVQHDIAANGQAITDLKVSSVLRQPQCFCFSRCVSQETQELVCSYCMTSY